MGNNALGDRMSEALLHSSGQSNESLPVNMIFSVTGDHAELALGKRAGLIKSQCLQSSQILQICAPPHQNTVA